MKFINYSKYISLILFLLFLWSSIGQWPVSIQWTFLLLFFFSLFLFPFLKGYYSIGFKPIVKDEPELKHTWWKDFGGAIYHIIIAIGIGAGAKLHENDFGGLRFLWVSFLTGALAGLVFSQLVRIVYPEWSLFKQQKLNFYLSAMLCCIFLAVCTGPFINQYKNEKQAVCSEFIIHPGDRHRHSREKYITLLPDGRKERFEPPARLFQQLKEGDSVIVLCIKKGRLGFEYVDEFRLPIPAKTDPDNP